MFNSDLLGLQWLRAKWQAREASRTLLQEAQALLDFLKRSGCTFHSCTSLYTTPLPRGISYRYDVHARDIPGCRAFIDFHVSHQIPATFFLFWDYSPFERRHFPDYMKLASRISAPLEIGLHDSPVDCFLIQHRFGGNRRAYARWAASDDAVVWLAHLVNDSEEMARLNAGAMADFERRVARTRGLFGDVRLVAGHGGELGQALRKKLRSLDKPLADMARSLRARYWLTLERVRAAGLEACVDRNDDTPAGWREASDDGGEIAKMVRRLKQRLFVEGAATQILIHPYTWAGAKRDSEFSQLLAPPKPQIAITDS